MPFTTRVAVTLALPSKRMVAPSRIWMLAPSCSSGPVIGTVSSSEISVCPGATLTTVSSTTTSGGPGRRSTTRTLFTERLNAASDCQACAAAGVNDGAIANSPKRSCSGELGPVGSVQVMPEASDRRSATKRRVRRMSCRGAVGVQLRRWGRRKGRELRFPPAALTSSTFGGWDVPGTAGRSEGSER